MTLWLKWKRLWQFNSSFMLFVMVNRPIMQSLESIHSDRFAPIFSAFTIILGIFNVCHRCDCKVNDKVFAAFAFHLAATIFTLLFQFFSLTLLLSGSLAEMLSKML